MSSCALHIKRTNATQATNDIIVHGIATSYTSPNTVAPADANWTEYNINSTNMKIAYSVQQAISAADDWKEIALGDLCENLMNSTIKGLFLTMANKCNVLNCVEYIGFHGVTATTSADRPYIIW